MAIIFYTHLLIPSSFADDVARIYPNLWDAKVRFPLSQLARQPSHIIDAASELVWRETYPDHPYQVVTFTPAGHHATLTAAGALDIPGYRCLSQPCFRKSKKSKGQRMGRWRVPMAQWSEFRLNNARMLCPSCKILVTRTLISHPGTLEAVAQAAFDVPIFPLWDKPMRQLGPNGFIPTVLRHLDAESTADNITTLQAGQHRYRRFLQLMPGDAVPILVPTIDIDLFWHTHQLHPVSYDAYCRTHIGRRVFHDDSIASAPRSNALSETTTAWAYRYTQAFLDPTSLQKQTAIRTAKTDLATARTAQTTQLAAFDAEHEPITSAHAAATARSSAAHSAAYAARAHVSVLDRAIGILNLQDRAVRPLLAVPGSRRLRVYSASGDRRRAEIAAKREEVERARAAHLAGELAMRDGECVAARRELEGCTAAWQGVKAARARLEGELKGRIAEAEGRVASWGASLPQYRTRGGGPMSAVVGTEAHVAAPIVGVRRTDAHLQQTWKDSWSKKRKPIPPSHEAAAGGVSGPNWALYGYVYASASYSGGGGGCGGGGGGGCGGGGGGGCGGGGCGGGGCGGG